MLKIREDIEEIEKFERIAGFLDMDITPSCQDRNRYASEKTQGALIMFEHFFCGDVKKIRKNMEKEWSSILDMLHPFQKENESIYETAVRMFDN